MVLILSILNDNALYLYQVLSKYLIGFQLGWSLKIAKGHNSVKCKWSYGTCSIHIV